MSGLRIQIDLKPGVKPDGALRDLYRLTPLEESFGINNVVLVNGVPTTLGLYDLCRLYIEHRLEVIVRRTKYRLAKARDRLHIVEGLLIALDSIDEVVAIIRGSKNVPEANKRLIERFELTDIQAAHILDMALRRLTALAKLELDKEAAGLRADIAKYQRLLNSETRRRTLALKELDETVEAHGVPRRSVLVEPESLAAHEQSTLDKPEPGTLNEPCVVTLSTSGNLGRAPTTKKRRSTIGRHDLITARVMTTTTSHITAVTSEGRAVTVNVQELPPATGRARGAPTSTHLGLNQSETVLALLTDSEERLVLVTADGVVKRLTMNEAVRTKPSRTVISLKGTDRVVAAFRAPLGVDIAFVASDGKVLRTPVDAINDQGRGAAGVAGMKLLTGSKIVGADVLLGDGVVVTLTSASGIKATPYSDLRAKGRGAQGVRIARLTDGETITGTWFGPATMTDVFAFMADYDDPQKLDHTPVAFNVEANARDLKPTLTERQTVMVADARW